MIYLWVRSTLDWQDEQAFWAQLDERRRAGVEIWNDTLNVPYHLFRHRVREIAALNQSRVRNVSHADWDAIPDGSMVLPVDDDDWFDPEVADVLSRQLDDGVLACRWPSRWIEVPLNLGHRLHLLAHRRFGRPLKFFCTTNNYAIVKRPETEDLLRIHTRASTWIEARLKASDAGGIRLLGDPLSLANRNLGSATVIDRIDTPGPLLRKLRRYKRLYRRAPRDGLAWARPYVAMMDELMRELEPASGSRS